MKLLIVDDHILFREGLAGLLGTKPGFDLVGQAGSVSEAVVLAKKLHPDLILMDFQLPDGTGAEATRAILQDSPNCKIIFLTVFEEDERLFEAIRSGAMGYLLKNLSVSKLVSALQAVGRGEGAISRTMTVRVFHELARSQAPAPDWNATIDQLSQRELDVLAELRSGGTNLEIAKRLSLSENTVKHHIHHILSKLNLENRHEAALFAEKKNLKVKPRPARAD